MYYFVLFVLLSCDRCHSLSFLLIVVFIMPETKQIPRLCDRQPAVIPESDGRLLRSSSMARGLFDEEPMVDNADVGAAAR